ncbi:MAG TPA: arylesterase [Vicinamibacteria bacterium]|nr:arylesterase [Vicinamibacteria bacterium]
MRLPRALGLLAALLAGGCGGRGPLVAFLGDSLTSGWKLRPAEAYPALVQRTLSRRGRPVRIVNAGVSGDTVAKGLKRLPGVLRRRPDVLVVALGINDGLLGLPPDATEEGLREILARARAAGARVLLCGLRIPPRHGEEHARRFGEIYPRLAAELRVPLVPFLLQGVAGERALNFPDGLHPTAEGQKRLAENVRPALELLLAEVEAAARR